MDKGILWFVAEAYLLLHSVSAVQAETKVEGAPADHATPGKQTRELPESGGARSGALKPPNP